MLDFAVPRFRKRPSPHGIEEERLGECPLEVDSSRCRNRSQGYLDLSVAFLNFDVGSVPVDGAMRQHKGRASRSGRSPEGARAVQLSCSASPTMMPSGPRT